MADPLHAKPWQLALVAGDPIAMRVLAAWYVLPKAKRKDIARLAELADVERVHSVVKRLEAVGLLVNQDDPPLLVSTMLNSFAQARLIAAGPGPSRSR